MGAGGLTEALAKMWGGGKEGPFGVRCWPPPLCPPLPCPISLPLCLLSVFPFLAARVPISRPVLVETDSSHLTKRNKMPRKALVSFLKHKCVCGSQGISGWPGSGQSSQERSRLSHWGVRLLPLEGLGSPTGRSDQSRCGGWPVSVGVWSGSYWRVWVVSSRC